MAENYLFFDSTPTDERWYKASDFAKYFGKALSNGLLHENYVPGLDVSVQTNTMNTIVSMGDAIIKGHLYENTSDLTLTHDTAELDYDRIDRIVIRLDLTNANRYIKAFVKKGVPSDNPVAPDIQRDNFIHELAIAQVRVRANTLVLNNNDVIDERFDDTVCGMVFSLLSHSQDTTRIRVATDTPLGTEVVSSLPSETWTGRMVTLTQVDGLYEPGTYVFLNGKWV